MKDTRELVVLFALSGMVHSLMDAVKSDSDLPYRVGHITEALPSLMWACQSDEAILAQEAVVSACSALERWHFEGVGFYDEAMKELMNAFHAVHEGMRKVQEAEGNVLSR